MPASPARCPVRVRLWRVVLGQRPSLHNLRQRLPAFVRLLRRYYAAVRLPIAVHGGLMAHRLLLPARTLPAGGDGVSRFSRMEFLCMLGVFDSAGPRHARVIASARCCLPGCLTPSAPRNARFRSSIPSLQIPLSNASSATLPPPSHGSGPGWFATPSLYDSFIRYSMPVYPGAIQVESRTGAGTDAERRPVSRPRSSNRTCPFRASGFPTGFIADSRTRGSWPLEPEHPQRAIHPFPWELAGALRGHLVPPSQEIPHTIIHVLIDCLIRPAFAPAAEVLLPASQLPIQLRTDLLPRCSVPPLQQLTHFLLYPAHALVRRTVSDVLPPVPRIDVRSECISQKIESLLPGIPNARLLFVECQIQPPQHPTCPFQCLLRLSATEDHEIIRVVHYMRPKLLPPPGLPPALQHPVHVQVCQRRTDHSSLRSAAIIILPARYPPFPVFVPLLDWRLDPHLDQMQHRPLDDSP